MRYESYKNSGIEWLGDIPLHWEVKRNKDFCQIKGRIGFRGYTKDDYVNAGEGALVIGATEMNGNGYILIKNPQFISWFKYYESPEIILETNDILVVQRGSTVGKVAIVDESIKIATINPSLVILKKIKINNRFLLYYMMSSSVQAFIKTQTATTAIPMISQDQIGKYEICIPNSYEQTAIAQYLDTKTQAIDKKINLLTKKTETYKELRKSIINDAVCKGLDKGVKLKESGIEWIGKIPDHWEVKRLKAIAKTVKGRNLEYFDEPFENSLPNLSLDFLRNDKVVFNNYCYTKDKSQLADENDLIIIWDGAGVGEILKGKKGFISSTTAKFAFDKTFSSKFFFHLRDSIEYTLKQIPTGMGIPHLNPQVLNNFPCPAPPKQEQTVIANYLDEKTQKIDAIVSNIGKQIDSLKELRKTLINDVVTGKIKVV
jgi:type I restriction enzyme S subunit